jgi:asparaginyl-tRNA synthetase
MALGDVYTFDPAFRAEDFHTSRHLAEFLVVEPEMAFSHLQDIIQITVELLKYLFQCSLEHCREDLDFFDRFIAPGIVGTLEDLAGKHFEQMSYTEAVALLSKRRTEFTFPPSRSADLQSEHGWSLCEEVFRKPVIVFDYPKGIKPSYMKLNQDGKTVRAMDVRLPNPDVYDTLYERIEE